MKAGIEFFFLAAPTLAADANSRLFLVFPNPLPNSRHRHSHFTLAAFLLIKIGCNATGSRMSISTRRIIQPGHAFWEGSQLNVSLLPLFFQQAPSSRKVVVR